MSDYIFINAFGQEFCEAIAPSDDDVVPQDGYEIFLETFNKDPDYETLEAMSEADMRIFKQAIESHLGMDSVELSAVQSMIRRTLKRTRRK